MYVYSHQEIAETVKIYCLAACQQKLGYMSLLHALNAVVVLAVRILAELASAR